MITAGDHAIQPDADDGWSIYTADGSLSAHFEHTVAVTESGPLVLTRHDGWSPVDEPIAA
jgi:methionyl aminopeptidase